MSATSLFDAVSAEILTAKHLDPRVVRLLARRLIGEIETRDTLITRLRRTVATADTLPPLRFTLGTNTPGGQHE